MLQNKFLFNQSSVSLEIIGLPDHSNNEDKDKISIISQWKLMIIDKPVIEGNIDHLKTIMKAFHSYSNSLLNEETSLFESNLIDIKTEKCNTHNILLKSSKPEVDPLSIRIGNSVLADIINCFDQLSSSKRITNINSNQFQYLNNRKYLFLKDKKNIINILFPPLVSLFSVLLVSTLFIYSYDNNDNRSLLNNKNKLISFKSINKLL